MYPIHNFGDERAGTESWYFLNTDTGELVRYIARAHYPCAFYCLTTTDSRRKTTINITLNLLKHYDLRTTLYKLMQSAKQDYTDKRTVLLFLAYLQKEFDQYAQEG